MMNTERKFVIAKCPNCNKPILYSDNPRDKTTVRVFSVGDNYHGKSQLCAKCKKMYDLIEQPPKYVVLPILQTVNL